QEASMPLAPPDPSRPRPRTYNPFHWMASADAAVVRRSPRNEAYRITCMGGAVLTTAAFAAAAAFFTTYSHLGLSLRAGLGVGLLWGLAILTLARWLLASLPRQRPAIGTLAFALPRVALALLVGTVLAEPIVLRVFDHEVTAQAVATRQDDLAAGRARIDR